MLNKAMTVIINVLFPRTHLQIYLSNCSQLQFDSKLTPRPQKHDRMFYLFYYKDPFVKDCVIELKERNSKYVSRLFSKILSQWILIQLSSRTSSSQTSEVAGSCNKNSEIPHLHRPMVDFVRDDIKIYLVPVPQHISKTVDKGFCHTTTLCNSLYIKVKNIHRNTQVFSCVSKITKTKKLHDTKNKKLRFKMIKNTMRSHITKQDAQSAYFFVIDDVFTTGATYKEVRRSLKDCAVPDEHIFFISIAH